MNEKVKNLGQYISGDQNLEEAYNKLMEQSKVDGSVLADDVVDMWQPLENKLTVDELLDWC